MRVLILTTAYRPLVGGSEIAIEQLTRRLPNIFFDMVTPRYDSSHISQENFGNTTIHRIGPKILFPIFGVLKSLSLQRKYSYKTINAFQASYGGGVACILKTLNPNLKFILTLQEGENLAKQSLFVRFFRQIILKKADVITAISNYLLNYAKSVNPKAKHILLPNGVDVDLFKGTEDKSTQKTIISVSRLVPKNGLDTLVRSMRFLPEYFLKIVGDGGMRVELDRLAKEIGVSDRVAFVGGVKNEELPALLRGASVFVRPSRSEGMGIAFIEAMAVELPVIATRVGGIPDFLEDRVTGLFCESENPESIANSVKILYEDKDLRNVIIKNARKIVEERYDWNKIALEYEKIIL